MISPNGASKWVFFRRHAPVPAPFGFKDAIKAFDFAAAMPDDAIKVMAAM